MKFAVRAAPPLALLTGLAGCVDPNEIKELKANQDKILEKLEEVAKKQAAPPTPARPPRPGRPDPSKVYAFDVSGSAAKGPKDAWVTIVEVSDFQCPFCSRVNPTLKQVKEKYKDDVRIVFKHNPLSFHQRAMPAANAAECAHEQGKFWDLHDKLFANAKALSDEQIEGYAKDTGLNMSKWKACYKDNKYRGKILKDQSTAARLGARGTPAFFVNGRFLSGAQPFAAFDNLVGEELKKAKASGVSKTDYYAKAVLAKGKKSL